MNKLNNIYSGNNGIFAIFANHFENEFNILFSGLTVANLDLYINMFYGNKILNDKITVENSIIYMVATIELYLQKWLELNNIISKQYDIINPLNETHRKIGTVQNSGTATENNTDFDRVFNDNELQQNGKTNNISENLNTQTYNLTETRSGTTANNITQNVENEYNFRQKRNLQKYIIETLINEISISIY